MVSKRRNNDGYCFIKGRIKPTHILGALDNIPYDLLPPTLKKIEDFLKDLNIKSGFSYVPELRINDSLRKFAKKNKMYPLIPYVKPYDKCDYGQEPIEMARNINIDNLYRGIEDGMYEFSSILNGIKDLINEKGKEISENNIPIYYDYPKDKVSHYSNILAELGGDIYHNKYTDFDTEKIKEIKNEIEEIGELKKVIDYNSSEWDNLNEKQNTLAKRKNILQEESKKDFIKNVKEFWINEWYDKNAWDFDENEKKELENPYLKKK